MRVNKDSLVVQIEVQSNHSPQMPHLCSDVDSRHRGTGSLAVKTRRANAHYFSIDSLENASDIQTQQDLFYGISHMGALQSKLVFFFITLPH